MTAPRWHWTGHVSVATHAGCALVERYHATWPQGLRGPRVDEYTITVVRGRARCWVKATTRAEARKRAVEAATLLAPAARRPRGGA